jgi:1-acyl-sn-glycerol-3-phosphate acyltransferase
LRPWRRCLLVANHLSYLDVITLWCATDGVFVAKSEVASWPLVGALGRVAQTLFVDRGRKRDVPRVIGAMQRALAAGESVILFGEGTSTWRPRAALQVSLFERRCSSRPSPARASPTRHHGGAARGSRCAGGATWHSPAAYGLMKLRNRRDAALHFDFAREGDRKTLARQARATIVAGWSPTGAECGHERRRATPRSVRASGTGAQLVLKLDAGARSSPPAARRRRHPGTVSMRSTASSQVCRVARSADQRRRDARLEAEPLAALARIDAVRAALVDTIACAADVPPRVRADEPELAPGDGFVTSSLARELRAVASHAVHHFALVALQLRLAGVAIDPRFGVAPSTWAHWQRAG